MSYILDALRKADAERRGVPAPHGMTEPAVLVTADPDADLPPSTGRPWAWVLGGVALALAASVSWHLWRDAPGDGLTSAGDGAQPPAQQGQAAAPVDGQAAVPAQGGLVDGLPPPAQGSPSGSPGAKASAKADPGTDTLPNFPPPLPEPPRAEAPRSQPAAPAGQGGKQALPPGIGMVSPAPAAAPSADRLYTVADLPDAVRRDLPRFAVGGAMYSDRVADRMVILNGQVFHEGDTLGKDLKLRQIKLKTAVLEFRGYRVEIGY